MSGCGGRCGPPETQTCFRCGGKCGFPENTPLDGVGVGVVPHTDLL